VNAHENVERLESVDRDGWFVRAASAMGDLGNPFYLEERQRDVWNEASAVGLQLVLWLGLGTAAAMVWLGGRPALPYAFAVFAIVSVSSGVSLLYANKLGVRVDDAGRVLRLRLVPYVVLLVLFFVGVVRAAPSSGFGAGLAWGTPVGGVVAVLSLVRSELRARRREQYSEV
jgi:hypothetical protein